MPVDPHPKKALNLKAIPVLLQFWIGVDPDPNNSIREMRGTHSRYSRRRLYNCMQARDFRIGVDYLDLMSLYCAIAVVV